MYLDSFLINQKSKKNENLSFLKLLGPILYQILWTLLNDSYAMYVHNKIYSSSFPVN